MPQTDLSTSSAMEHLKRLLLLRSVLTCALAVTMGVATLAFQVDLHWLPMIAVLLLLPAANVLTSIRLRRARRIEERELFLSLMFDVAVLAMLLYLSGGPSNPFISLLLLPLIIAATTLPPRYAWSTAAITAVCYAVLFFLNLPLEGGHATHGEAGFRLHLVGMWCNFVLSAAFIAFFVVRMAQAIRSRDAALARQQANAMRNERIVALGTLAAGAAHELGTPLSTMAVVLGDLAQDYAHDPQLAQDLATLRQQVDSCKQTITRMVAGAGQARAEGGGAQPVDQFLRETLENWRLLRPSVKLTQELNGPTPAPTILTELTLRQAILNLLNNAADASPHSVELDCNWGRDRLRLEIRDRGPGLSNEARARVSTEVFTTKAPGEGNGIGLLLAKATLERLGGNVRLERRDGGGIRTLLDLPLEGLAPGGNA